MRIVSILDTLNLEPRALGKSGYPTEYPLREVYVIAKDCSEWRIYQKTVGGEFDNQLILA